MINEEVKIILDMVKDGKISVDEAEKLISKVHQKEAPVKPSSTKSSNKKFFRMSVTEGNTTKVNINVPLALAEVGLRLIPQEKLRLEGVNLDFDELYKLINEEAEGELVNIDTMSHGQEVKVKISID